MNVTYTLAKLNKKFIVKLQNILKYFCILIEPSIYKDNTILIFVISFIKLFAFLYNARLIRNYTDM